MSRIGQQISTRHLSARLESVPKKGVPVIADDLQPLARPIKELKPLEGNPRRGNVEAVMKSYQMFGQRKPIVARQDGTVIAGNHQLEAAKRLGWKEIAVVVVDDDDTKAQAFALADNRTGDLGGYDDEALVEMLSAVEFDLDLLEATAYTQQDLDDLRSRFVAPSIDDLADKYGEIDDIDDSDLKPTIKIKVRQEVFNRWLDWVAVCAGDDETAINKLLDKV